MSLAYQNNLPGIDAAVESIENEFTFGPQALQAFIGVQLDSAAVDAGNTPTTTLRRGLVLGKITSSGKYTASLSTATDGSQEPIGILWDTINMYDPAAGAVRGKQARMLVFGHVKTAQLYGFSEYVRRKLSGRFVWDDYRQPRGGFDPGNVTANYTILSTDNGTHFFWNGSGAGQLTLPTPARGLSYRVTNNVDQDLTILAGAGKMASPGNGSHANIAFTTSSHKVGQTVEFVPNHDASQWVCLLLNGNTTAATRS